MAKIRNILKTDSNPFCDTPWERRWRTIHEHIRSLPQRRQSPPPFRREDFIRNVHMRLPDVENGETFTYK